MKSLLGLLKTPQAPKGAGDHPESVMFQTAFAGLGIDESMLIPWEARANEIGAKRSSAGRCTKLLQALWAKDKYMGRLSAEAVTRLEKFFFFASVPGERDIIRQEEYGNFMIVLLTGTIAVDRIQPWGEHLRLSEARPGDILGEMSLLDSGQRFSVCTTLNECEIAILGAEALDEMMLADPALAASMIALLARRLSLRLRAVSARLSDRPA